MHGLFDIEITEAAAVPLRCIRDLILINAAIVQKRNQGSCDAFFK